MVFRRRTLRSFREQNGQQKTEAGDRCESEKRFVEISPFCDRADEQWAGCTQCDVPRSKETESGTLHVCGQLVDEIRLGERRRAEQYARTRRDEKQRNESVGERNRQKYDR